MPKKNSQLSHPGGHPASVSVQATFQRSHYAGRHADYTAGCVQMSKDDHIQRKSRAKGGRNRGKKWIFIGFSATSDLMALFVAAQDHVGGPNGFLHH